MQNGLHKISSDSDIHNISSDIIINNLKCNKDSNGERLQLFMMTNIRYCNNKQQQKRQVYVSRRKKYYIWIETSLILKYFGNRKKIQQNKSQNLIVYEPKLDYMILNS